MKKISAVIIVLVLCISLYAGYDFVQNSRSSAMGNSAIAYTSQYINYFRNPAAVSLYNNSEYNMTFGASISDSYTPRAGMKYITDPDTCIKTQFIGENISMGFSFDYDLTDIQYPTADRFTADSIREFELDVCISGNLSMVSGGIGVHFTSPWIREQIPVDRSQIIADLVREAYLFSYKRVPNGAEADLRAGAMVSLNNYSVGLLFEDIVRYQDSQTVFSFDQLKNGISFALSYNQSLYTKRGRLVPVVYSFELDGQRVFDTENGSINAGLEVIWQLVRKHSIALRIGYDMLINKLPYGTLTAGLGFRIGDYDLSIEAGVPSDILAGDFIQNYLVGVTFTVLQ